MSEDVVSNAKAEGLKDYDWGDMNAHIWDLDKCKNKNRKLLKSMVDDINLQILNCIWESMKGARLPNDTAYKWWSCHSRQELLCKLCRTLPPPANGGPNLPFFWHAAMRTRWMAGAAAHKSGVMSRPIQVRQH